MKDWIAAWKLGPLVNQCAGVPLRIVRNAPKMIKLVWNRPIKRGCEIPFTGFMVDVTVEATDQTKAVHANAEE